MTFKEKQYLKEIKNIIYKYVSHKDYKVFVYGSRADGTARVGSDFDVGLVGKKEVPFGIISLVKEDLSNSNIPYFVDIVDFSKAKGGFKNQVVKERVFI